MQSKRYLFISGCARSGTSALTILLGSHPEICLGMERYGHLVDPEKFSIDQSFFEPERFLDLRPTDTFYTDLLAFHKWCPNLPEKIRSASIVGDKRPEYYRVFDKLNSTFINPKFIHIIRNYVDVAFSWEARAKLTKDWPESKDALRSIKDWNAANEQALEAHSNGYAIMIVDYDLLFSSTMDCQLDRILNFLDLTWNDPSREAVVSSIKANALRISNERQQRAELLKSDIELQLLAKSAITDNFNKLIELSNI
jgi:hypothetical protein